VECARATEEQLAVRLGMEAARDGPVERLVHVARGTALMLRFLSGIVLGLTVQIWVVAWEGPGGPVPLVVWLLGVVGTSLMVICLPAMVWVFGRQLHRAATAVRDGNAG
jgi:hypothetical protein